MEEELDGTASPAPGPREATVYGPELKLAMVKEYLSRGDGISRASFAREKGIPPSTFDGWLWKYAGIERGHARESAGVPSAMPRSQPIDVTGAIRSAATQRKPTATIRISGVEIETDAAGFAMIVEALRRC